MPKIIIELTETESKVFDVINADGAKQWIENAAKERVRVGFIDIRNKLIANGFPVTGVDMADLDLYAEEAAKAAEAEAALKIEAQTKED